MINNAGEKLNTSLDLRDKACVDTRQTLVIAYNDIISLKEQLGYRNQHQLSIEKAREAYRKQFDIGQRTLLDLLDTENEYFQARRAYANAERDLLAAYARTYASQGDLLRKVGVVRGDLPDVGNADYTENYKTCQAAAPEMIVIDKASLLANAKPLSVSGDKFSAKPVATAKPAEGCNADAVTTRVNDWASAWRHKDFDNYMRFYAEKFTPEPPQTRAEWEKQRKARIVGYGKIDLELSNVKVTCSGDKAQAAFDQDYSVTKYKLKKAKDDMGCEVCNAKRVPIKAFSDKVNKTLDFEKINGQWQIVLELVNP
jgi:adhesin transport system outer membrane protein